MRDTNDLQSAFRRIEEDMRFHYVLTYAPSNQNFDGQFREIDVKVRRPGARVFARRGYFAVRSLSPMPILGYESVPLAALDQTPLPNAFPMRAGGLSFPEAARPGLTPILVAVQTDVFSYDVDQAGGTYSAEAIVVVRVRDTRGRDRLQDQPAVSAVGTPRRARRREVGRDPVLPAAGTPARRLQRRGDGVRREGEAQQRSHLDGDRARARSPAMHASAAW